MLGLAEGRVLDVGGSEAHRRLYRRADDVVIAADGWVPTDDGSFDTVVTVMHLAASTDPGRVLDDARRVLAPGGLLRYLEPSQETGWRRRAQHAVAPAVRVLAGWRPDRDPVALIRHHGWVLDDIERIPVPRYAWPLTGLVEGTALVLNAAGTPDDDGDPS